MPHVRASIRSACSAARCGICALAVLGPPGLQATFSRRKKTLRVAPRNSSVTSCGDTVNTRSNTVNTRSDAVNTRSDAVSTRSGTVNTRSDAVTTRSDAVNTRSHAVNTRSDSRTACVYETAAGTSGVGKLFPARSTRPTAPSFYQRHLVARVPTVDKMSKIPKDTRTSSDY